MRHLCIILFAALAATAAEDPAGWSKARWGMTDAQIVEAFGAEATRLDPPEQVSGIPVRTAVPVELAGVQFRALMLTDKSGKLTAVLITPTTPAAQTDSLYQSLQELLVQKYSRPRNVSEEMGITELQWLAGSTVITLIRGKLPLTTRRIVNLKYEKQSEDLKKLETPGDRPRERLNSSSLRSAQFPASHFAWIFRRLKRPLPATDCAA